jgi:DNA-directed RNA polymerase specialized sigma subunit
MTLTTEEQKLTKDQIRNTLITLEENNASGDELRYYRLLLAYKHAEDKRKLAEKIKQKLNVTNVGGTFTREEVAKVMGLTERQVNTIEKRALKKMKMPKTGKMIKEGMYD